MLLRYAFVTKPIGNTLEHLKFLGPLRKEILTFSFVDDQRTKFFARFTNCTFEKTPHIFH